MGETLTAQMLTLYTREMPSEGEVIWNTTHLHNAGRTPPSQATWHLVAETAGKTVNAGCPLGTEAARCANI